MTRYRYIIVSKIPGDQEGPKLKNEVNPNAINLTIERLRESIYKCGDSYKDVWKKIPEHSNGQKKPLYMVDGSKIVFHTVDVFFEKDVKRSIIDEYVSGQICCEVTNSNEEPVRSNSIIFAGPFIMDASPRQIELHLYVSINNRLPNTGLGNPLQPLLTSPLSIYNEDCDKIEEIIRTEIHHFCSFPDYISNRIVSIDGAMPIKDTKPLEIIFSTGAIYLYNMRNNQIDRSTKLAILSNKLRWYNCCNTSIPTHISGPKLISEAQYLDIDPYQSKIVIL